MVQCNVTEHFHNGDERMIALPYWTIPLVFVGGMIFEALLNVWNDRYGGGE